MRGSAHQVGRAGAGPDCKQAHRNFGGGWKGLKMDVVMAAQLLVCKFTKK